MPQFLGADVSTEVMEWSTAHADIQWSNLAGPELCILDWERWGLAPAGYDEATLYISSLTSPAVADRVFHEFKPMLESTAGHFAQLVVASEYLRAWSAETTWSSKHPCESRLPVCSADRCPFA
ncbi:hypothetical protein OHB49_20580 [Streptomyces sp. NBC_01717]|uniref:hypothetical protein n=1 Tax=Streptomyces sp. NBC_01717 TaxID=2975918 RepID=UPI002E349A94|nr:hypothetical protein [Streptomyces sp. NBC_01717]